MRRRVDLPQSAAVPSTTQRQEAALLHAFTISTTSFSWPILQECAVLLKKLPCVHRFLASPWSWCESGKLKNVWVRPEWGSASARMTHRSELRVSNKTKHHIPRKREQEFFFQRSHGVGFRHPGEGWFPRIEARWRPLHRLLRNHLNVGKCRTDMHPVRRGARVA